MEQRKISFGLAMIPLLVMITAMAFTIVVFEGSPHVPLILGSIVAAFIAWQKGFRWGEMESGIYDGIKLALPAIVILIMVGLIIGAWIGGGVVATLIYYGLKLLSPSFFLVSITILTAIVSLAIGSSWSTMATIGVAGMGIGVSMGIPEAMVAGAIISGSYFGDKMSPLSDTTNLSSGVSGAGLFEHIRHMFYSTIPGLAITLVVYWFMGMKFSNDSMNANVIDTVLSTLDQHFVISPWLLIIPALVIVLVSRKVPALPALAVGVILGFLAHIFIQGGNVADAVKTLHDGYAIETKNELIDSLLNRGGIESMMYTISLTIVAMTFGGILEKTGMLEAIVGQILKLAKTSKSLVATTVLSSFITNIVAAEQYISIVLPGRMYTQAYQKLNLHPKNLSRALEDGGTLTSPFVPWNTCGVFIIATLGVHPFAYAPYAVLNYVVPLISITLAFTGYSIVKLTHQKEQMDSEATLNA